MLINIYMIIGMSIVNSTSNRFTYTDDIDYGGSLYVTQNNKFETISGFGRYVSNQYTTLTTFLPKIIYADYPTDEDETELPANTAIDIIHIRDDNASKYNTSYQLLSLHIPVKVNDFTQITSNDSMTVSIRSDGYSTSYSIPLNNAPITVFNGEYVPPYKSRYFDVSVEIPYDGEYINKAILNRFWPSKTNNTLLEIYS